MEAFSWTVFEVEVSINEVKGDAYKWSKRWCKGKWKGKNGQAGLINILETYTEYWKDALTTVVCWQIKKCKWLYGYKKNTT